MPDSDLLLIGLGNPGAKYDFNRHNVGFLIIDELARRWGFSLSAGKWQSQSCRERKWGSRVLMVKPQTFMNRSGQAVAEFAKFYKIPLQHIIVIHDDLDMHPGRLKLVQGGGAGGHNGIRSITQSLGGNDFFRLKIGIGRPGRGEVHPEIPVESYVLSNMGAEEQEILESRFDPIEEGLRTFIESGVAKAMSLINSIK
ncbi:aminoacyl-tRNA hydrolase [Desulfopila sp. IMCC35008]|uniref:aminoacyl-tRNA hydrolase n=1 Tax=Desulfopila sp. IMCC35008 TaxID=2653858 RepID=UPI0013D64B49|nr:aminoacyl-tRNA hydrolase [Desulfopila sp. IMCC35008]